MELLSFLEYRRGEALTEDVALNTQKALEQIQTVIEDPALASAEA